MPPAARVTDQHVCGLMAPAPHVGGPIVVGAPTVLIGFMPAARIGDMAPCAAGPPDAVVTGAPTVLIAYLPAARIGDSTAHGGIIVTSPIGPGKT